jgi:alpha-galactosidase
MKMSRRDFFPTAYLAALAGTELAAGKKSPVDTPGRFHFDPKTGRYSLPGPVGVKDVRMGVEIDGVTHWADAAAHVEWSGSETGEAKIEFASAPAMWRVRFDWESDGHALLVSSTLENHGKQPLKLGRCRLIDTTDHAGQVLFGAHPEKVAAMVTNGGGPWRTHGLAPSPQERPEERSGATTLEYSEHTARHSKGVAPGQTVSAKGPFLSKILTQWFTPGSGPTLQFGFLTFDRAEVLIESGWDEARNVPVVSAWTDFQGTELQPGASVDSEVLRIGLETNPHAALEAWGDAVYQHYHPPLWPKIPGGWVGGAWVDVFNTELYEDMVHRNIRAMRNRLKLDGNYIQYVWVSIGNLKDLLPGNWLNWNYDRFPSGPEALEKDLSSLNFQWGLWTGAFWMSAKITDAMEELKDAWLKYQGKPIIITHRDLGPMYVPDPTHPKTQAFVHRVYATYRKWGVRYFMIDFTDAVAGATPGTHPNDGYFDKTKINGPEAWREGYRAIREAAGDDTYLLGCNETFQTIGYANGQRVGSDYGEGRPLYGPNKGFYPGTFVINKPDYWNSHLTAILAMAYYFVHRKLYLSDSGNVMSVDKPLPLADAQIAATIFGINGGPVMLGDDIERMDEDRMLMVRSIFPRLPECARPLDLFDNTELDYPQVFHLKVEREWDSWDLLAVFNLGEHTLAKTLPLERLGLDPKASYAVFDFWNQRFQGIETSGAVSVEVPPDSVKLLRIARDHEHPWLLSTDMHIRQGQAEILDCKWDEDAMTLTVRAQRPAGHEGSIYAHAPKGWALAEPKGLWLARDGRDNSLVIRKAVAFEGAPIEVQMRFKRYTT